MRAVSLLMCIVLCSLNDQVWLLARAVNSAIPAEQTTPVFAPSSSRSCCFCCFCFFYCFCFCLFACALFWCARGAFDCASAICTWFKNCARRLAHLFVSVCRALLPSSFLQSLRFSFSCLLHCSFSSCFFLLQIFWNFSRNFLTF